ncbi:MAG: endolytic transglycosylase MltG [Candidatus Solibacter usitatus]|nr:endolytic transglycosylase MltG [Candidatus Solibacter usitatus]
MKKLLAALVSGGLIAALAAGHYWVRMERYRGFGAPVFVEIPKGTSSLRIGEMLAQAGVVRHPLLFLAARLARPAARPQAGEYQFSEAATAAAVFARIARGDVYTIEFRVPEGSNVFDIGQLVEHAGFGRANEFVRSALGDEGFLFPSTYHFRRTATGETVRRAMRAQFDKVWEELGAPAGARRELVTLASLVETEAVLEEERVRIAGVYTNRLRKGMKLECDPTVEYAAILDGRWRGVIRKSDLASRNRYNTYQHAGLPPGPVANPGLASLRAALKPQETGDLYFVARPDRSGGHVFSVEYGGHQKAVAAYRNGERQAVQKSQRDRVAAKPGRGAR